MAAEILKDKDAIFAHDGAVIAEISTGMPLQWVFPLYVNDAGMLVVLSREAKLEWQDGSWRAPTYEWPMKHYGRTWRLWSERPTADQTENAAWRME